MQACLGVYMSAMENLYDNTRNMSNKIKATRLRWPFVCLSVEGDDLHHAGHAAHAAHSTHAAHVWGCWFVFRDVCDNRFCCDEQARH